MTLTLTYTNALGTGATPAVSYTGTALADAMGTRMPATLPPHVRATDGVPPALAATVDSLYTRARHAGEAADTAADPAGTGAQVRVYVRATEPLVAAASDISFYAAALPASGAAPAPSVGTDSHVYWRTVAAGDANGPLAFALTITDAAGLTTDLTHADLTSGRGAGTGHRTSVDTVAPTATAAFVGDTIEVTFSEPAYGVPATLSVAPPSGAASALAATHADGDRVARIAIAPPAAAGDWTVTVPGTVADQARNALSAQPVDLTATKTDAPTATAISYAVTQGATGQTHAGYARVGDSIAVTVTLSEAVSAAPTVLFVGKTAASDRVTMTQGASASVWTASYTVESVSAAPGIDGQFTFSMAVAGSTGSAGTITQAARPTAPPTIDRVAPEFTAQTADLDTVTVDFSEQVRGTTAASEWGVDGTAPDAVASGGAAQSGDLALVSRPSLTLDLAAASQLASGAARPAISFDDRASGGITDLAGNPMASTSSPHVTAADRILPTLVSMVFSDADTLAVTLSEPVERSTVISLPSTAISPQLGTISVSYTAGATALTLDTQRAAAERATHAFTMPTSVTDAANGAAIGNNNFAAGSTVSARLPDTTPPTVTAIRTVDERTVELTFSEAIIGTTAASEWAAGVRPAGMSGAALPTATTVSTTRGGTGASATIASADAFTGPLYVGFALADMRMQT